MQKTSRETIDEARGEATERKKLRGQRSVGSRSLLPRHGHHSLRARIHNRRRARATGGGGKIKFWRGTNDMTSRKVSHRPQKNGTVAVFDLEGRGESMVKENYCQRAPGGNRRPFFGSEVGSQAPLSRRSKMGEKKRKRKRNFGTFFNFWGSVSHKHVDIV